MATSKTTPWYLLMLIAIFWPMKIFFVYFRNCAVDVARELKAEWIARPRYTGWER